MHSKQRDKYKNTIRLIFALLFSYTVMWSASVFTSSSVGSWYKALEKPFWNPPNSAFPIVWTILYTMIGIAFWKILCTPKAYTFKVFAAFFVQMLLNFTWSLAFFYLQNPALGLITILALLLAICWNIRVFNEHSKLAVKLLVPYFLWVFYASTLNLAIWYLNPS